MLSVALILVGSYLLGSIPTGLWIARSRAGVDVRRRGSGSSGGTNVARVLGWRVGVVVVALDAAKGALAVLFAQVRIGPAPWDVETLQLLAGLAVIAGHVWPALARFEGGKGVATAAGTLAILDPVSLAVCLGVFAVVLAVSRIVALASASAVLALPIVTAAIRGPGGSLAYGVSVAALVLFLHRSNLRRFREGREPRLPGRTGDG